jgi:hypothetical protein
MVMNSGEKKRKGIGATLYPLIVPSPFLADARREVEGLEPACRPKESQDLAEIRNKIESISDYMLINSVSYR